MIQVAERDNSKEGFHEIEMDGLEIGPLAVTRCLGTNRCKHRDWTVTHSTTGFRVYGCIGKKKDAIKLAEALQGLDWNFKSHKSPKVKAMALAVERIIQKWFKEIA